MVGCSWLGLYVQRCGRTLYLCELDVCGMYTCSRSVWIDRVVFSLNMDVRVPVDVVVCKTYFPGCGYMWMNVLYRPIRQ